MPKCDRVIFRRYPDGDVIALFLDLGYPESTAVPGEVMSYMHIGQHGAANPRIVRDQTKPATKAESAELAKELRGIGYRPCRTK